MWSEDEPSRAQSLPSSVRRAHMAARRPAMGKLFTALCAATGGIAALFITIALTSGMCFGDQLDCGAIGQPTVFFSMFSVPLGIGLGVVLGGSQVDRAIRAYRPTM